MAGRVAGKSAVVVGAGQTPGETVGNGRALALLLAREGAKVLCVDRVEARARETAELIAAENGTAAWLAADITRAADCQRLVDEVCRSRPIAGGRQQRRTAELEFERPAR